MNSVMGIINLNENEEHFRELTYRRPVAAVPFGGRYRLIDFVLSNMINSGIPNVGILTKKENDRALMDHLRSGKEWDLARKRDGLFLLPPAHDYYSSGQVQGDLKSFFTHFDYIQKSRQQYLVLASSNTVCNVDYRPILDFHQERKADITVLYKEEAQGGDFVHCTTLNTAVDGRITDMEINPQELNSHKVSMEMYIMHKSVLMKVVSDSLSRGGADFIRDGLIKNLGALKIYGFPHEGYAARIHSVLSYYRHSMGVLEREVWQTLFTRPGPIYTKVKDEPPTKYKEGAHIDNSLLADGCVVEGHVENSIVFRAVKVHKNAYIKNSIIMQKCEIGENSLLENVICDKEVILTANKHLKGENNLPIVIRKGMVV